MNKKNYIYFAVIVIFTVIFAVCLSGKKEEKLEEIKEEIKEELFEKATLKDPSSKNEVTVYQFIDDDNVTVYNDGGVSKLMTSKDNVLVSYMIVKTDNPDPEKQIYASLSDYISQSNPDECVISEGAFLEGFYAKAVTDNTLPEPVSIVFAAKRLSQNSLLAVRTVLASGYDRETAAAFFDINHINCPENAIKLGTISAAEEAESPADASLTESEETKP